MGSRCQYDVLGGLVHTVTGKQATSTHTSCRGGTHSTALMIARCFMNVNNLSMISTILTKLFSQTTANLTTFYSLQSHYPYHLIIQIGGGEWWVHVVVSIKGLLPLHFPTLLYFVPLYVPTPSSPQKGLVPPPFSPMKDREWLTCCLLH